MLWCSYRYGRSHMSSTHAITPRPHPAELAYVAELARAGRVRAGGRKAAGEPPLRGTRGVRAARDLQHRRARRVSEQGPAQPASRETDAAGVSEREPREPSS